MNLNVLLVKAINASLKGGISVMDIYSSDFKVESKKDHSPLTLADKNCNDVICSYLKDTGIPILSEEGADIAFKDRKKWAYYWLVDPLDGTKEFVNRNGEFNVPLGRSSNNSKRTIIQKERLANFQMATSGVNFKCNSWINR